MEDAISRKANVTDFRAACRTIRDAIRDGKQYPIDKDQSESSFKYPTSHSWDTGQMGQESRTFKPTNAETSIAKIQHIESQAINPDYNLGNDESQIELLTVEACTSYPIEWDEPCRPHAKPTIKVHTSSASYFEWQRQNPPFNQLGLASLQ
ncbi:hypothetical protein GO730_00355 [Spirosoma sp. HMF3257]|uniref:Uncharacterized protein n=1 Tax=Spirosoma telluris TaxID=2183553 RepID=A0A327NH38_9BACT|nr:hypothetical protein [Spirosoma telluris]RAI73254.1 hypothetical protein HMF3257_00340 [Spirosoma telluris]